VSNTTYSCIRVKDVKKPLKTRCHGKLGRNGVLCDDCYKDAKKDKIPVLMCADVTSMFKIPFKNQVFVYIDLSAKKAEKEVVDTSIAREQLWSDLSDMEIEELERYYSELGLMNWSETKRKIIDPIKFNIAIIKEIITHLQNQGK
jgi:hypothetical protein